MSVQTVMGFLQRIKADPKLRGQLGGMRKAKNPHAAAEIVAKIATAAGFPCSATDVESYFRSQGGGDVSDQALNSMLNKQ
jgi:predicted ribosomally synthesized peptide with nif11-like leader